MRPGLKDATASAPAPEPDARRAAYLTRRDDIAPMLKILRDHSAEIELRLAGVETEYKGRILDLANDHFLLEDIRPRDGLTHLRRGTRFSFSSRVDDLYICGEDCKVTRVESERGLPYFRADLPKRMLRHRRRRHARITLPPRVSPHEGVIRVLRQPRDEERLHGQIIDISVGGCRVAFGGAVLPAPEINERLTQCDLQVSSSMVLAASGVIRHIAWDAERRTTNCGIEFDEMSIADRRRLEHYVSQLTSRTSPPRG